MAIGPEKFLSKFSSLLLGPLQTKRLIEEGGLRNLKTDQRGLGKPMCDMIMNRCNKKMSLEGAVDSGLHLHRVLVRRMLIMMIL